MGWAREVGVMTRIMNSIPSQRARMVDSTVSLRVRMIQSRPLTTTRMRIFSTGWLAHTLSPSLSPVFDPCTRHFPYSAVVKNVRPLPRSIFNSLDFRLENQLYSYIRSSKKPGERLTHVGKQRQTQQVYLFTKPLQICYAPFIFAFLPSSTCAAGLHVVPTA